MDFLPFYKQKSWQPVYFSSANVINLIDQLNNLLLKPPLLKFSSNILQIEYQMLVLAHTDLIKYEVKIGISSHILQMGGYMVYVQLADKRCR